ncbi:MAG: polyprenyl synthetase family protein [Spirochaetes bacterium]|nr:polyprenyl synthetase family protein [Spirochaetota bacterium]
MIKDYNFRLEKIEEYLYTILPKQKDTTWAAQTADITADHFGKSFLEYICNINIPLLDLLERGGKRWRPMLMLLLYEIKNSDIAKIIPLTPLVELGHNGSLIVDDIEDNSELRRGKPAIHILHGVDMSINSANFLYFLAYDSIEKSDFDDALKFSFYRYYTKAMKRLHVGQGLDIQWHNNHSFFPKEDEYYQMCRVKTGALSRLAAEIALSASGAASEEIYEVGRACEEMGVGFQIIDDVINLTKGNPGKKRGDDIIEGKKSLPVILFCEDKGDVKELVSCFRDAASIDTEKRDTAVERAIALLEKNNSIEKAKAKALDIIEKSAKTIESKYEDSIARKLILSVFDSFKIA